MSNKFWLAVAFIFMGMVIALLITLEDTVDLNTNERTKPHLPAVSIVKINANTHTGSIDVFAEIKPRWQVNLKSHVKGEVLVVMPHAIAGKKVTKGETLLKIEDSSYKAQLHEAEQLLAQAQLELLQEQKTSDQAKRDWKRSGLTSKPSELTLNIPQLALAEKKIETAKSNLTAAKKNVQYTIVKAPFTGFVTTRHISLGQTVEEGDALLDVIGSEHSEVSVSLSERQWRLLDKNWQDNKAKIYHEDGSQIATASVIDGGDFLDPQTRQYSLFLEVDRQNNHSLTGSFVNVRLAVSPIKNSLKIPESSISREGYVWFVNDQNQLNRFSADILFRINNEAVIRYPADIELEKHKNTWRIAITPLASFIVGNQVEPISVDGES